MPPPGETDRSCEDTVNTAEHGNAEAQNARKMAKSCTANKKHRAVTRLAHLAARALVGQGDIDELVQAARAQQRGVNDVGAVGGADDEHLRQNRSRAVQHAERHEVRISPQASCRECVRAQLMAE